MELHYQTAQRRTQNRKVIFRQDLNRARVFYPKVITMMNHIRLRWKAGPVKLVAVTLTISSACGLVDWAFVRNGPDGQAGVTLAFAGDSTSLPKSKVHYPTCLKAATSAHPGQIETVEFITKDGVHYYRFGIRGAGYSRWTVLCDARSGAIVKAEPIPNP